MSNPAAAQSGPDLLKQAILLYDDGNKPQARYILQVACQMEPENEVARLWRAGISETAEEAIEHIDMVIGINPKNMTARKWQRKFKEARVSNSLSVLKSVGEPGVNPEQCEARAAPTAVETQTNAAGADTTQLLGDALERTVETMR